MVRLCFLLGVCWSTLTALFDSWDGLSDVDEESTIQRGFGRYDGTEGPSSMYV
jgi:hypothetical protein